MPAWTTTTTRWNRRRLKLVKNDDNDDVINVENDEDDIFELSWIDLSKFVDLICDRIGF